MIEVDVFVPALKKTYDFELDEHTSVANIIEEIVEMVCQNEHRAARSEDKFELCCPKRKIICRHDATLDDYSVDNGDMLMLI